jgi:hypothetical protein
MEGVDVRRTVIAMLAPLVFLVFQTGSATAQVFYQYPDAAVIKAGEFVTGPDLVVGDHALYRAGGFARMNVTKYFDVGFELLGESADGDERWGAGGDLRFAFFPETNAIPFDLSMATGVGVIKNENTQIIQIPLGGIISSPFQLDQGNILVPYLGVYMLFVDTKLRRGGEPDFSDSDLDVEIRAGLRYSLSAGPDIFVGFHLGRDALVTVGMSFWLKRSG